MENKSKQRYMPEFEPVSPYNPTEDSNGMTEDPTTEAPVGSSDMSTDIFGSSEDSFTSLLDTFLSGKTDDDLMDLIDPNDDGTDPRTTHIELMDSSDLISFSPIHRNTDQSNILGLDFEPSAQLDWPTQDSEWMSCDPSMLMPSVLQGGGSRTKGLLNLQSNPIQIQMPTTNNGSVSLPPPTYGSLPSSGGEVYYQLRSNNNPNHYYDIRVFDPMLNQGANIPLLISQSQPQPQQPRTRTTPNVEVLTRDPATVTFYNENQTRRMDMKSERKVKRKSSHVTSKSSSSGPGGPTKTIKRQKKQSKSSSHPRKGRGGGGRSSGNLKKPTPHVCPFCLDHPNYFPDAHSLKVHIWTHTGEKPFACADCKDRFRQKAHLEKHYEKINNRCRRPEDMPVKKETEE